MRHTQIRRPHAQFRSDVEGLRALSIVLVVLAHAGTPGLAGGFVGVDVFFVLSGFLITRLLLDEAMHTGRIDFLDFYARRVRRLMPALLVMLAASSILGAVLLAPMDQPQQATAATSAALWLSNMHFAATDMDYFGIAADRNMFLHTWSLGVEEQFYLVWPVLVVLLLHTRIGIVRSSQMRRFAIALSVVCVFGALACAWTTTWHQRAEYYFMPSRAREFAAGGLLAWYQVERARPGASLVVLRTGAWISCQRWLGWSGIGAIIAAALLVDGSTPYPGAWALLPALGTCAVLLHGSFGASDTLLKLLGHRLALWLGKTSYSLYLWHWPVFVLGAAWIGEKTLGSTILLAAISLLLAAASHAVIERPIRRNSTLVRRPGMTLAATASAIVVFAYSGVLWRDMTSIWIESPEQARYSAVRVQQSAVYTRGCDDWIFSSALKRCDFGPADAPRLAVVMGDSVGLQWFPALEATFTASGWRLVVLTKSSCPMVDSPFVYAAIGRRYRECETWRTAAVEALASLQPDMLILGSSAAYPFSRGEWLDGTTRFLSSVAESARAIRVIVPSPLLPFDAPSCLAAQAWRPVILRDASACQSPIADVEAVDVIAAQVQATGAFPNARAIQLNDLVCPMGTCSAKMGDFIVYRDAQHLAREFVRSLSDELATRLWNDPQQPEADQLAFHPATR